ncbi:uncharacterized protein Z519_00292 [Cladophialophora bantiana CBS 173.52]|uniref:Heterokaryon incompatibility domain-containing protein n=1 Tax=Cladophialophora bantiana (strain ATCC 10958 / CBS 173.52 / CDC B-1940 / NIH 8579) TaxID=1442370 RepID=A0A0D2F966_CLAB1|nr:uncharacterized protein Z519_00292 [Cladophialophora bantiana CBS 173.52]KIW98631.1 hypothetical protein Z519_00292 [Cladophialophora bantiana CBS 173.52]
MGIDSLKFLIGSAGSTEYNPYFYSQHAEGADDYTIHSPPPARQNPGRIPRRPTSSQQRRSPYEPLPVSDAPYFLPPINELAPEYYNYNQDNFHNPPPDHPAGSFAPSTNNVSTNEGGSDFVAPLNIRQKLGSNDYEGHNTQAPNENPYLFDADTFLNRASKKLHMKRTFYWLDPKFFHERAWFSWTSPHSYQLPGHYYRSASGGQINIYRHRDVFRRKYAGLNDDRYLDPLDGRVEKLFVQTVNDIYDTENDTTWRRTYIENVSPWIIRLAYWPYAHMPVAGPSFPAEYGLLESSVAGISAWKREQWLHVGLRWLPTCIGLLLLMTFPTDIEGQVRNHGNYDPVPYRYWSYPLSARNFRENIGEKPNPQFLGSTKDVRLSDRCLRPRLLCFLDCVTDENPRGCLDPRVWIDAHGGAVEPTYIFISYTAENQFERRCRGARKDIQNTGSSHCNCPQCCDAASDAEALHNIARLAAKKAQVAAYWTDQCCMSTDKDELQEDVYRISDVVRGAAKIVIVVGRTGQDHLPPSITTLDLLKEWGTRMWTWPEVLLGPAREKIQVYTRRGDIRAAAPLEISKMEFPAQVWDDGEVARQLIDNYEGSLALSRLELVVLALECLKRRVEKGTTKYLEGDLSYALMGLLRQRPKVDKTDSAFQAFARLSLANDSDRLLERMICLLPFEDRHDSMPNDQHSDQNAGTAASANDQHGGFPPSENKKRHDWTNLDDYWGAKLWDVEPICQVAGIGQHDTVILDGAYGATVHWDKFQRVAITTRETWSRMLARYFVRGTPAWFFTGVLALAFSANNPTAKGIGAFFLVIALITVLLSPMLILHIYGGKVWNTQPWLFGFEGHMSLRKIEMKIFGFPSERLSWAPYASNMSHHRVNSEFLEKECEGTDPLLAGENERGAGMVSTTGEKLRHFTLVDTNTMTVTSFRAARPPTVALLCGSEGGMQRAVMCSYDWTNQCLWRETVLRMETIALQKMPRIGRVRFGLRRWETEMGRSNLQPPD